MLYLHVALNTFVKRHLHALRWLNKQNSLLLSAQIVKKRSKSRLCILSSKQWHQHVARAHIPMHCLIFPVRSYDNQSENNNQMLSLQSNTMAELNLEEKCSNDIFEKKQQSSYKMGAGVNWAVREVHVWNSFLKSQFLWTSTTALSWQVENLT